jgi:exosortase
MKSASKTALRERADVVVGRKKVQRAERRSTSESATRATEIAATPLLSSAALAWRVAALALLAAFGLWSYWPTLAELVRTWRDVPDYSHGFLVAPLALYFLWARRDTCPAPSSNGLWMGLALMTASVGLRFFAARYFMEFLDAWSILPWAAAIVVTLFGTRTLWWSLPSIAFLFFMIPLPFTLEGQLSAPLQKVATKISCFMLQMLGQPTFSEGNIIVVGETRLEVAQACSGLRLFFGVAALAFAYAVLVRRTWWERLIILASTIPVALVANAARIVATGLLLQVVSGQEAQHQAHDWAGWAMIPLAAALFWLVLWYLDRLLPEEEVLDMSAVVREARF